MNNRMDDQKSEVSANSIDSQCSRQKDNTILGVFSGGNAVSLDSLEGSGTH